MRTGPDNDAVVTVNGVALHYTEWNRAAGDATLLVHGRNTQLHTWDPIAAELAATRRVICVDLRGHGRSGWPLSGYALELFAADLIALLEHFGIDEVQYVGHSLGGRVGIAFAALWGGRTRHLLLSDCGPEMPAAQSDALREMARTRPPFFDSEADALGYLRSANPRWQDAFHHSALEHQYRTNWVGKVVPRADPEVHWLYDDSVDERPYLWECWARVSAPITLLWGTESGFLDNGLVSRMLDKQPAMAVHRPNGSHWYLRESPQEFLRFAQAALTPRAPA